MHTSSYLRMQWFEKKFLSSITSDSKLKVLDVGSYDVNGSYKEVFDNERYEYTGLDMEKGPNVDLYLRNPYVWNEIETDSYDVIISGQAFEHIEFFWITLSEMARVLKRDGIICIIAPNGFKEHRYPVDCYRFFTDGMISLARYIQFDIIHAHTNLAPTQSDYEWFSDHEADSMLIARKPYEGITRFVDLNNYYCKPANHEELSTALVPSKKEKYASRILMKYAGKLKSKIEKI